MILSIGGYTLDTVVSSDGEVFEGVGGPPHYHTIAGLDLEEDVAVVSPVGRGFKTDLVGSVYTGFIEFFRDRLNIRFLNDYRGEYRRQKVYGGGYRLSVKPVIRFVSLIEPRHIIVSPVLDEVPVELVLQLSRTYSLSIDLQGFVRRVDGEEVVYGPIDQRIIDGEYVVVKASIEEVRYVDIDRIKSDILLITLGHKGCILRFEDRYIMVPAVGISRNPTGAGDYFLMSFISRYLDTYNAVGSAIDAVSLTTSFLGLGDFVNVRKIINDRVVEVDPNTLF